VLIPSTSLDEELKETSHDESVRKHHVQTSKVRPKHFILEVDLMSESYYAF
jgi:hypothetical protein